MHPEFLTRLREEILSLVGPTRRPTYDDIKELKYLRAVLNGTYFHLWFLIVIFFTEFRNASPFPCRVSGSIGVSLFFIVFSQSPSPFNLR